jgi:hypothetical protein
MSVWKENGWIDESNYGFQAWMSANEPNIITKMVTEDAIAMGKKSSGLYRCGFRCGVREYGKVREKKMSLRRRDCRSKYRLGRAMRKCSREAL